MLHLICKWRGHAWTDWRPLRGRFQYEERECQRCIAIARRDVQLNQVTMVRS